MITSLFARAAAGRLSLSVNGTLMQIADELLNDGKNTDNVTT